jgi:hypothetical protein
LRFSTSSAIALAVDGDTATTAKWAQAMCPTFAISTTRSTTPCGGAGAPSTPRGHVT